MKIHVSPEKKKLILKMNTKLLVEFLVGGIVTTVISLLSSRFGGNKKYYKILGFVWALPVTLPFILHVVRKETIIKGIDTSASFSAFLEHATIAFVIAFILTAVGAALSKQKAPSWMIRAYSAILAVICVIYVVAMNALK